MFEDDDRTVVLAAMMLPSQANSRGTVHGGEIMKMMDSSAVAAAVKFCKIGVVTARVDELQFMHPIHIADYVTCMARVVYVGRTSLEVFVRVTVENLRGTEGMKRALEAYFTLVALDENEKPTPVKPFTPSTPLEREQWEYVAQRRARQAQSRR